MLNQPLGGARAVEELGANLARSAKRAGMTTAEFERVLRTDSSLRVDECGYPLYVEPVATSQGATTHSDDHPQSSPGAEISAAASDDPFALASRPGSSRTIYLNFVGATVSGTAWNSYASGGAPIVAPAFSLDEDVSTFTASELDVVRETWLRVAEDYAPFDVNVTTADPGAAAINRSSVSDNVYGTVALITNESQFYAKCGCGGIAYLGVFDYPGTNTYYQPAWVFALGMHGSAKNIAEATSHELGHNLGLVHDGTLQHDSVPADGYYSGQGAWAPIMGVGYSKPVSQWSKGEYAYASNFEDDLAVMQANGVQAVPDDHGGSPDTATQLTSGGVVSGIVGTKADTDWFVFVGSASTTINATVQSAGANLDVGLQLYDESGNLLVAADPPVAAVSAASAVGLGATITTALAPGTYYVKVDGVGHGSASATGYSDYASLGRYGVSLTTTPPPSQPVVISTDALPDGTVGVPYSGDLAASGGSLPYTWSMSAGSLPPGLALDSEGVISGTPTVAGSFAVSVRVTDARGRTDSADLSLVVEASPLLVTTTGLPSGEVGVGYDEVLEASGGSQPYRWEVASGSLPEGLTLDSEGLISGTPVESTAANFTVTVTDSMGASASSSLVLSITTQRLAIVTLELPEGEVDLPYSTTLVARGGTQPYRWSTTARRLPYGFTLSPSGQLSGSPNRPGLYVFTFRVADAAGAIDTRSVSLSVTR